MDLYKIYNLPALHPKLKVEFTYQLEGEYLAITKNKLYAALPTAGEIRICKGTEEYTHTRQIEFCEHHSGMPEVMSNGYC